MTDACENITFPQLLLWTVTSKIVIQSICRGVDPGNIYLPYPTNHIYLRDHKVLVFRRYIHFKDQNVIIQKDQEVKLL